MAEIVENQRHRLSIARTVLVQRLQFMSQRPQLSELLIVGVGLSGRFLADVSHTEQFRLRAAPADGEVQRAVGSNRRVGERQRRARDEFFLHGRVAGPLRLDVNGVHRAKGPVEDVKRLLVLGREPGAVAEGHPHGRARTGVDQLRQAVDIISRPFTRAAAPAEFASAGGVDNPRGPIPGGAEVPFHVGVVNEQLAVGAEVHVVGIAIAGADDFPVLTERIGLGDPAAGGHPSAGMSAGVPLPRQQQVFAPVFRQPAGVDFWQVGVIAADDVNRLAVGRKPQRVRPVFAAAGQRSEFGHFVVLIVAVGVAAAIQPAARAAVDRDVQAVERTQQAMGRGDLHAQLLDLGRFFAADGRRRNAVQSFAALVTGDDAALGIGRDRDPRTLLALGHGVKFLDLKAGEQIEHATLGVGRLAGVNLRLGDRWHLGGNLGLGEWGEGNRQGKGWQQERKRPGQSHRELLG